MRAWIARLMVFPVGGRPLGARRVRLAAVSYALFSVGLFNMAGVVAGEALSAL